MNFEKVLSFSPIILKNLIIEVIALKGGFFFLFSSFAYDLKKL